MYKLPSFGAIYMYMSHVQCIVFTIYSILIFIRIAIYDILYLDIYINVYIYVCRTWRNI